MSRNTEDFTLYNTRIVFPHLFTKAPFGENAKYGAKLLLDPKDNKKDIDLLQTNIKWLLDENNKGKKIPSDKMCLRNGDDLARPEFEGKKVLSGSYPKPIPVFNRDRSLIVDEEQSPIVGGYYVNANISLWWMDSPQYGKRICCNLIGVQFAGPGEVVDATYVSEDRACKGFNQISDEDREWAEQA